MVIVAALDGGGRERGGGDRAGRWAGQVTWKSQLAHVYQKGTASASCLASFWGTEWFSRALVYSDCQPLVSFTH